MPIPKAIDFGFQFDDKKLWSLEVPSEEMKLDELKENLDIAYLEKEGTDDWNLTPRELIEVPEKNPSHFDRVKKADLKYPIEIYDFAGGWKILDGVHRFCKATIEGRKTIAVRKITDSIIKDILK